MKPSLEQLSRAERDVFLYLNREEEPVLLNRIKKFLRHPFKYTYHNLCKAGVLSFGVGIHTPAFWGADFFVPLSDENASTLYYTGTLSVPEIRLSRYFIRNITSKDVFYDVGANLGYYSGLASALGAEVHAFEPNPSVFTYVEHNARGKVNTSALGATSGEITLFDTSSGNKSGMSTTLASVAHSNKLAYKEVVVPCITLDQYVTANTPPTFIKIDVEGFEEYVLQGATKLLETHAPVITMEIWDAPQAIEHSRKALDLLKRAGYVSYKILRTGETEREDITLGSVGTPTNYCFIKAKG